MQASYHNPNNPGVKYTTMEEAQSKTVAAPKVSKVEVVKPKEVKA